MYITDYTERSDLAIPPTALWSHEYEGRIVTLELHGPQSKMADKVDIGAFFNVKHMRLIERVTGVGRVVGRIGGPDRLIHKLNANNPNEELKQLFLCDILLLSFVFERSLNFVALADEGHYGKEIAQQQQHEPRTSPPLPAFLKAASPRTSSGFVRVLSGHSPCS